MRHYGLAALVVLAVLGVLVGLAGCSKKSTAPAPTATLTGVVHHPDGSADAHALVDAQTLAPFDGVYESSTAQADSLGAFGFGGLRVTGYSVSVDENDSLAVADTAQAPASGIVLRLQPAAVLRGVALRPDTTDKQGVLIMTDLPAAFAFTDTLGFYDLRGVAPGRRDLVALDLVAGTSARVAVNAISGDTLVLDTLRLHAGTPAGLWETARMRIPSRRMSPRR
jgi:hypothetical protein